jgi:hypothetical protein
MISSDYVYSINPTVGIYKGIQPVGQEAKFIVCSVPSPAAGLSHKIVMVTDPIVPSGLRIVFK